MILAARLLRDRRRAFLWWSLALVVTVGMTAAIWPSVRGQQQFEDLMRDLPEGVRALVGAQGNTPFTSPPGYLNTRLFGLVLPVLLLVFGIGIGGRAVGGAEEDGTLELLLAQPLTRARLVAERFGAVALLLVGLAVVSVVSVVVLGAPVGLLKGISLGRLGVATAAMVGLASLHASIAFAAGCALGRRGIASALAGVVAVGGYLLHGLIAVAKAAAPARFVSPWHWYLDRNFLVQPADFAAVVLPFLLSAVLVVAGRAAFVRRDLRLP